MSDFSSILNEIQAEIEREAGKQPQQLSAPSISANADNAEKTAAFKEALSILSKPDSEGSLDEEGINSFIEFFTQLYGGGTGFRHLYSDVCNVMYGFLETKENLDEGIPPQSLALANNMEIISREISRRKDLSDIAKSVRKIHDHVELERTRLEYMFKQNEWQRKTLITAKEASEKADKATQKFNYMVEESERNNRAMLEDSKRDYITILGIFAAIVIAFTAGSTFSASVLQNIDKASIYRICLMVTLIGLFLFNTISILLTFITNISKIGSDEKLRTITTKANIIFLILLVVIICAGAIDSISLIRHFCTYV